jgi:hypothetical protein
MNNLAYKEKDESKTLKVTKTGSGEYRKDKREWVFIDLEDFEYRIRQEEREKFYGSRMRERARKREYQQRKNDLFLATLIFRILGAIMIGLSFMLLAAHPLEDGTWSAITLFIGALFVIMPGYNKPK